VRIVDLIEKKKRSEPLSKSEIEFVVNGFVDGMVADYQMSAFLMAVCFNGMDDEEIWNLTQAMLNSGDRVDLSKVEGITVDKHSTGGVGDKVTFVAVPIAAACGVKVAKMSGRGLGFTGGTIDKLEAIPGYRTDLPLDEFVKIVNTVGLSNVAQMGNLCPADKKIYALRDVTGTVDSLPLIVSSIMSKKLATGADCIVFDVKTGSGSFCPKIEDAVKLAEKLIYIGKRAGKKVSAIITDMEQPLGYAIGNALEVNEAMDVLKGSGSKDVVEVCVAVASEMLFLAKKGTLDECKKLAGNALKTRAALEKFRAMTKAHGVDVSFLCKEGGLTLSSVKTQIRAPKSGYICRECADWLGKAASLLGAGRMKKGDNIDFGAGIKLHKKCGDFVKEGEVLVTLYSSEGAAAEEAVGAVKAALRIGKEPPKERSAILKIVR